MTIEGFSDDEPTARAAAKFAAAEAATAFATRGQFVIAVSGGRTPWIMLRALGNEDVRWERIHILRVDERVAPAAHPDRNLVHLRENLLDHSPIRPEQTMPCRWNSPISKARPASMPCNWPRSLARRQCWTWCASVSDQTTYLVFGAGDPVLDLIEVDGGSHRCPSRKAANDIDISDHQSLPVHPVAGDGQ